MRDTGICPKCGGAHVVQIKASVWSRGYSYIYVGVFTYLYPSKYICSDCGFIESYIDDPKDLNKLKGKFRFVKDDLDHFV